jgi:apolipoprotein N-acyltransferase
VCLAPLIASLRGRSIGSRAVLGALTGAATAALTVVGPLGAAFSSYFGLAWWQGGVAAAAVGSLFAGGGFALFAVLAGDLREARPAVSILRVGAAWVAADGFREVAFTGLPWLLLGHLLAPFPALAQLAALGGVPLLSLWIASANACAVALLSPGSRRVALFFAALWIVPALGAWVATPPSAPGEPGSVRLAASGPKPASAVRVVLVQPSIPRAWRTDLRKVGDTFDRLVELSNDGGSADLLIWPENALHVFLPANLERIDAALERLDPRPGHLLLGAPRSDADAPDRLYNAALLFDAQGAERGVHDKVHLVPFTEYIPWPFSLVRADAAGLRPGDHPVVLVAGETALGPLICYEMLFAGIARQLVRDGADVLVNLSNDGYFGGSGGAEQHLTAAVLRAIELRRPVLRATSDGITVAIDQTGRVVGRLRDRSPDALAVDVWPQSNLSPATRVGSAVSWACLLGASLLTFAELRRRAGTRGARQVR